MGMICHFHSQLGVTNHFNVNEEGNGNGFFLGTTVGQNVNITTNLTPVHHEDFYLDEGINRVVCRPECGKWEHYTHHTAVTNALINYNNHI